MNDKNIIQEFYQKNDEKAQKEWIIQWWIMWKLFHLFERFSIWRDKIALELIKKYNKGNLKNVFEVWVARWNFFIELSNKVEWIEKFYWVDVNENRIKDAKTNLDKQNLNNELKYMNIDEWLDYNDNSFDLISCLAVLEHVFDPIKVVEEFSRTMKKDWLLVIEVPNIVVFFRRIAFLLWVRPRTSWDYGWDGWHLQYFTVSDLKKLLENNWFEVLETSWSWVFAKLRNWWVSMLSADIVLIAKKK